MFDVLIKNAVVIDGTGEPMYKADIGIRDDRIEKIGRLLDEKGEQELDVAGRMVCPGFVDVNNHSDTSWQIFSNPQLESLIYQGITTIIGGNCGSSLAPLASSEAIYSIQKWGNVDRINISWQTVGEFLDILEKKKLAVNFGTLVGHGTLRRGIMKDATGAATLTEQEQLKRLLDQSMREGALGLSSGLVYVHERKTSLVESQALATVVEKNQGVYATHLKNERENFLEALAETVALAEATKASVHISHLKAMEEKNWGLMDEALAFITKASSQGTKITFDVYPYTRTGTVLYTLLPQWISDGGKRIMLERLKDAEIRQKIIAELQTTGFDWAGLEISKSFLSKVMTKKKISEIAAAQNKSAEEAVVDVLLASEGTVIVFTESLNEDNVEKALIHAVSLVATNGSGYSLEYASSGERVHPRSFGTFPRVLSRYVREKKVLRWEEAIRKMTSLPAQKFHIKKRGEIQEGFFADLVVFDMDKIKDLATAENPYQYSQGIDNVLINGKIVLQAGKITGQLPGKVLRHKK